ncbi:MAG TPA: non-heme iron oxygenase ferredoxin subunit [Steroidobacteraceae bacterium]|nr:non-heme iron oxygenase ferredoxin subunit [Steroidobacteraceae bacterium]
MLEWVRIPLDHEVPEGSMTPVTLAGKRLILYRTRAGYFVSERRCTHQGADLLRGYFEDETIECPVHQGRFNVRTGKALSAPVTLALKTYPVRAEGEAIFVELPGPAAGQP